MLRSSDWGAPVGSKGTCEFDNLVSSPETGASSSLMVPPVLRGEPSASACACALASVAPISGASLIEEAESLLDFGGSKGVFEDLSWKSRPEMADVCESPLDFADASRGPPRASACAWALASVALTSFKN